MTSKTWLKLTSWIMTAIMALAGVFFPGFVKSVDGIKVGDWLVMLNEQFGVDQNTYDAVPHYGDITADNTYFATVQRAYECEIITDFDKDIVNAAGLNLPVTNAFVATTLVRAARLNSNTWTGIPDADQAIAILVAAGLLSYNIFGNYTVKTITIAQAKDLLARVKALWASVNYGEPAVEAATQDEIKFSGDVEPALEVAQITAGNGAVLQNSYVPLDGETAITESQIDIASLLQKLDVSFSLSGFNFKLKVTDTGFNLGVGATVCDGVKIAKTFEVSNLNVATKFDGNIVTNNIKEAYLRADYNLKDITTVTGSYATSVAVDPSKLPDGSPVDFMTAAKAGALALMPGGGNKITVFSFEVPIPNCPAISIALDVNLCISVDGKISITISSSNVKGIEIVNNKVKLINETTYGDQTYDIMADVRFTVGLDLGIKLTGVMMLVDAEFSAGVGIKVTAFIQTDTAVYTLDMPLDLAIAIPYPTGGMDGALFCGNAKVYGLMSVSVGQNSPILKKLGLTKTWVIFDENNAVIYNFHIEETGVVPECTRART